MTISPMFASSPDGFVLVMLFVVPYLLVGLAVVSLVVNAKWGRGRLWGFVIGAFTTVCGGTDLAILHTWGEHSGYWFWAGVCATIAALSSLFLWGRTRPV
jgi:hypothetical protein